MAVGQFPCTRCAGGRQCLLEKSTAAAARRRADRALRFDGDQLSERSRWCWTWALNQPHRAGNREMMTRVRHRPAAWRRPCCTPPSAGDRARALAVGARYAPERSASGLYERVGFNLSGVIPDYRVSPHAA